jgi:hypothetical protein
MSCTKNKAAGFFEQINSIMKQKKANIDQIRTAFEKMQSREDLLHLMNEVKPFIYGEMAIPFELKQLTWYANPKLSGKRYTEFKIKKKSGAERSIHSPVKGMKAIQRTLAYILHCVYEPHKAAMGFVRERSIVDNARIHVGNRYVYNIDLKDFFPSIDQSRVWKCLQLKPIDLTDKVNYTFPKNVKDEKIIESLEFVDNFKQTSYAIFTDKTKALVSIKKGFKEINEELHSIFVNDDTHQILPGWGLTKINGKQWIVDENDILGSLSYNYSRAGIADLIAKICCTELEVERKDNTGNWIKTQRKVLPQGAPTSPIITNIVCQKLDYLLSGVAKRFGLKYSRYADDITFSSMHNVYQQGSDFLNEIHRIIEEQNFHIKESKTRLQKDGFRKEVTGLIVNEKVNLQQRYIKQLRMWLYYWERYGYERTYSFFLQQYFADKGHIKNVKPDMANVISGKLDYLKMVKGADNELYLKLKSRFDSFTLINKDKVIKTPSISFENILSIGDLENTYITKEEAHQQDINRLRININPINSSKGLITLKRQIIIKKGESLPHEELLENNEEVEKEIDLSKHKPLDVSKFLKYFQNGKLKWLTHKYDEGSYNRSALIQEAKDEFMSLTRSLVIQPALYGRVNWFGFVSNQEKFYFLNKYHYTNWQAPNLLKWEVENPNMHPINSDLLFIEMFVPFKKSIELKDKELKNHISNQLVSSLGGLYTSFDFEYNDLDNVNFYTDVDALKRGLSYLFNAIKQRSENSYKVKFNYRRVSDIEGRKRILEIIHINSSCNKSLEKNELFKGDLLAAEKALFGICDWSIISKSPDDSVNKLNVLFDINSNKMPKEKIEESLIEGFTHILTFYA